MQYIYDYQFLSFCRYAACLPVMALLEEYSPVDEWDPHIEVEEHLTGRHQSKAMYLKYYIITDDVWLSMF